MRKLMIVPAVALVVALFSFTSDKEEIFANAKATPTVGTKVGYQAPELRMKGFDGKT